MFVELVNVPLMFVEFKPTIPPVILSLITDGTGQLYFVLLGTIPFVRLSGVIAKASPLQTVLVIGLIVALGFTVTVTVKGAPEQDPDDGITV